MTIKGDAITVAIAAAVAGAALWYVGRKVSGGLSSLSDAASAAGAAISSGAGAAWDTANTQVLPTDTGVAAVDGAAGIANGIVSGPTGALDGLSIGLLGGSGGNAGNGGIGAWLWSFLSGEKFKPEGADTDGAPFDFGTGPSW
ncbi:hypothetical protein [Burkholderia perseverans]|uniref:hypothetical protein n=1 Tax=Burkholderia perseverans TaxID=2615214 RepID=UPI001FEF8933|nr:hypothetical protein [Burkholderia perseverans]